MRLTWSLVLVAACYKLPLPTPALLREASGPPLEGLSPKTWPEALCCADLDAARELASTERERGLTEELGKAHGEGPDLQRLGAWLNEAPPEHQRWLTNGFIHWLRVRGVKLGEDGLDPEVDPELRSVSSAKVPVPTEPFTLPLRVDPELGRVFVEVSVAGEPQWFLVDTGANATMVSDALLKDARYLGEAQFNNVGQDGKGRYAEVDLALGPLQLPDTVVVALPTEALFGGRIVGILGWPVLRQMRVELDFVAGTATFGPPGEPDGEPELLWWDGYPMVRGTLQGKPALLWLDTGVDVTKLLSGVRERGLELPSGPIQRGSGQTLAGRVPIRWELVPGPITVGIGETEAVLTGPVPLQDMPHETDWCFDAWLGLDVFRSGTLVLDATAGEVLLRAR
jgi:hypothetical protein